MTVEKQCEEMSERLLSGNRRALAKAITLIENSRPDKRVLANHLISRILPETGKAIRVGISGVPGVGKSTFIESLGLHLVEQGHKVAVLAVDPSSKISGGSILGDKVRMERLSRELNAFIRPSPSAGSLGGVARRTRESMLLCEAAGFDVILVETVGVGQSEITVSEMVDCFMVLLLPGGGDEIQGIKKGIIEMADVLVINKADGDLIKTAKRTQRHYRSALHFLRPKLRGWSPPVRLSSAATGEGINDIWESIEEHRLFLEKNALFDRIRREQMELWFHATLRHELMDRLYDHPDIKERMTVLKQEMGRQEKSPHQCAEELITQFLSLSWPELEKKK